MSLPARPSIQISTFPTRSEVGSGDTVDSEFVEARDSPHLEAHPQEIASVSNDNNILLDPDVLTDHATQVGYQIILIFIVYFNLCSYIYVE